MMQAQGTLQALATAAIDWLPGEQPRSRDFDDCYFSQAGGDGETEHVFLQGNALPERFAEAHQRPFCVGELGFGSGLNFLLTWALLRALGHPTLRLHYWSVDLYPLQREDLARSLACWPRLASLAEALLEDYPPPVEGIHRRHFDGGRVVLDCLWTEAGHALAELASDARGHIDAWYLDGFSPARNGAMWRPELFSTLAVCSRPNATVASYSAAGAVRRALTEAGFEVHKRPGFGHKRECISAVLKSSAPVRCPVVTPWERPEPDPGPRRSALVIGAGLAGAHAAFALARRGLKVVVLDAKSVAGAASGNPQGILFNRLSHRRAALGDFSLGAFLYARALYASLFATSALRAGIDGALDGCFQLPGPRGDPSALAKALSGLDALAQPMDADVAARHLGTSPAADGLWQPGAGWLSPGAVCRALLRHPGIELHEHRAVARIERSGAGHWRALAADDRFLGAGDALIIAAGLSSQHYLELGEWLPLKPIRGQTTQLPAAGLPALRASYCHSGYIAPAQNGEYCIGASFHPGDADPALREADQRSNLKALAAALPAWREALRGLESARLEGRAAVRCATTDYLPTVGPVPRVAAFRERYQALSADARRIIDTPAPCYPQAFLSTGHGSRGLSYAALGGEIIASQLCGEPPPLPRELLRAVAPARFLVRGLIRGAEA